MYAVIIAGVYCAGLLPLLAAQSCECAILRVELPLVAAFMTNTVSNGGHWAGATLSMTVALLIRSTLHVIVATAC